MGLCFLALFWVIIAISQSNPTEKLDWETAKKEKLEGTKKLAFLIGEWESETWFYVDGKRPEEPEKGTYKAAWALNGAFVTDDIAATHQGEQYLGKGYHSYNPHTQLFGKWEDDKTLVFSGKDANPSGVVAKKTYFSIHSPSAFDLIEKQDYGDGKGFVTVLQVNYKRVAHGK